MKRAPEVTRGPAVQLDDDTVSVPARPDTWRAQRRHVKALDRHLGIEREVVDLTTISPDYWADSGMNRSIQWREFYSQKRAAQ